MSNLYLYKIKNIEYVVIAINEYEEGVEIHFVGRVDGGKGRIPKNRIVDKTELTSLIDGSVNAV